MNLPVFKTSGRVYDIKSFKFGSLNRLPNASGNEFCDTLRTSGENFPVLKTGKASLVYQIELRNIESFSVGDKGEPNITYMAAHNPKNIQGAVIPNKYVGEEYKLFCGVADNKFYFDSKEVPFKESDMKITDGKKEIFDFNGKIIIMPDRLFYCYTAEYDEYPETEFKAGEWENTLTVATDKTKYLRRMARGKNKMTCATSGKEAMTMKFSYPDVTCDFIRKTFNVGDRIEIDAVNSRFDTIDINSGDISVSEVSPASAVITDLDLGTDTSDPKIIVEYYNKDGRLIPFNFLNPSEAGSLTADIWTYTPKFCAACVRDNRIFGSDEKGRMIYASRLGCIDEFSSYNGLESDSFSAEVGTDGEFLRFITYKTALIGFKKDYIHILYGNSPKTYQITKSYNIGLANKEAVCEVNGVIYFLSHDGIYAFCLDIPQKISDKLNIEYESALFETDGKNLYIAGKCNGTNELIVYDTQKRIFHKTGDREYKFLYGDGKYVYGITTDFNDTTKNIILRFDASEDVNGIKWRAETNFITDDVFGNKSVIDLYFMANVYDGGYFDVYVSYDGKEFIKLRRFTDKDKFIKRIPVRLKPCDRYKIKFEGYGNCEIFGYERKVTKSGRNMR